MSQHTPHQHKYETTGGPTTVEPTLIDVVTGDPPVPITVWRTAPTDADHHATVPARLAYRLVAAYSRPGEAVVDLTCDHALTAACVSGRRRHHRACFTDSSSLIIGPATPLTGTTAATDGGETDSDPDAVAPAGWFGDDLTDPDLPPPGAPVAALPHDGQLQAATSLVVACWPLDAADAPNRVRLAWLLAACARLLRPGGCLVLVVGIPVGMRATPEDFGPLVAAVAAAGLGYLQHIVAVAADTDGEAFIYHVTDEELLTLAHTRGANWTVAHLRVHADLLVFTQAQFPATSRKPMASRREPEGPSASSRYRGSGGSR